MKIICLNQTYKLDVSKIIEGNDRLLKRKVKWDKTHFGRSQEHFEIVHK